MTTLESSSVIIESSFPLPIMYQKVVSTMLPDGPNYIIEKTEFSNLNTKNFLTKFLPLLLPRLT